MPAVTNTKHTIAANATTSIDLCIASCPYDLIESGPRPSLNTIPYVVIQIPVMNPKNIMNPAVILFIIDGPLALKAIHKLKNSAEHIDYWFHHSVSLCAI